MTDEEYDATSKAINTRIATGNKHLDSFFRNNFTPDSGMWIHKHPHKERLQQIYYAIHYPRLFPEEVKRAKRRQRRLEKKYR